MTWKEIQEKYPDQWVALTDVVYLNNDNCNVESAVLVCAMSDEEYVAKRLSFINEGKNYECREQIKLFQTGMGYFMTMALLRVIDYGTILQRYRTKTS